MSLECLTSVKTNLYSYTQIITRVGTGVAQKIGTPFALSQPNVEGI